ncbi:hypothetical protein BYT27DRAFT_6651891 [Phlegmacium glaucopus]|nr:hypothetical protein BYT27DRAFT_6651891 [Phlegmacium glaucopus]
MVHYIYAETFNTKHPLSLLFTLPYDIPSRKMPSTDVRVEGNKMGALIGVLTIRKATYHRFFRVRIE